MWAEWLAVLKFRSGPFNQVRLDINRFPCRHFSVTSTGGAMLLSKHCLCKENTVCISVALQLIPVPLLSQLMSPLLLSGQQEPEFVRRSGCVRGHGQAWRHDSADCAAQRGERPLLLLAHTITLLHLHQQLSENASALSTSGFTASHWCPGFLRKLSWQPHDYCSY